MIIIQMSRKFKEGLFNFCYHSNIFTQNQYTKFNILIIQHAKGDKCVKIHENFYSYMVLRK